MTRISATGCSRRLSGGFSLLELLVVVTLMALITGTAVIGLSAIGQDGPRQQAQRFALVWDALCADAAIDARVLGLVLSDRSYQAVQPGRNGQWMPLPGVLYPEHNLPDGLRLSLEPAPAPQAADALPTPHLLCLPGGINAEQSVLLRVNGTPRFRVAWDDRQQAHAVADLDHTRS